MIRAMATAALSILISATLVQAEWQAKSARLMTPWAADVTPDTAHREYPRPQMVRQAWQNLNGLWDYAITKADAPRPAEFDGQILVPFPIESALSGVMRGVKPDERLWYRRTFTIPAAWQGQRLLLHFGAVDWHAIVTVNGNTVGQHRGGFDPFTFEITDFVREGENEIVVIVADPTDQGYQPRGKQHLKPHGIWYTPVTGIWQTVWIEPVPATYIRSLKIVPDVDDQSVHVTVQGSGAGVVTVTAVADGEQVASGQGKPGEPITLNIVDPKLWSPDSPHLYDVIVTLGVDAVVSYFGMRKIAVAKDAVGLNRLVLNGEPLFQYGPLDQGWWPDGLYTAPTDEALRFDIEATKAMGFNMARKHVKVEPARWYYWCDKLGLLVWQDMPSGDRHAPWNPTGGHDGQEIQRSPESTAQYEAELREMLADFGHFPSIVVWVPFNEAWGQFDTVRIGKLTKQLDPTRLVNIASGGNDFPVGEIKDIHRYPGPAMPDVEADRIAVLGEFGGLGLPIEGHTWLDKGNWGYRSFQSAAALTTAYDQLIRQLHPLIGKGLAAAVYTQTTDVEIETNGLLTYDRKINKMGAETVAKINARLYQPPPVITTLAPTAEKQPQAWRYTMEKPADDWTKPAFDDSGWQQGPAGFGEPSTPGSVVRTNWKTPNIWIRRTITLADAPSGELGLLVHYDEDATVYINGEKAAELPGYTTGYTTVSLNGASKLLKKGPNVIAIHCKNALGGQYIDLGIVEIKSGK